jgi:HEAT repeats
MIHSRHRDKSAYVNRCWMVALAMFAMGFMAAEDQTPDSLGPKAIPKAEVTSTTSGSELSESHLNNLVTDALAGNVGAIGTLRTSGLEADDRQALAILKRVRGSGAGRNSAIAACFVRHHEAWVQRTAIDTIAALGIDSRETLDLIGYSLEDHSPMVAQAAATALSHLRDPRSWSRLINILGAKDPEMIRLAHESLQLQTNQSFPPDQSVWDSWLKKRLTEEEEQFSHFQRMVNDPANGNLVTAVDGLASLILLRDQASSILITLAHHADSVVRAHVERHLRQWTGTPGGDSLDVAVERAQSNAIAPPPLTPLASPAIAVVEATPQLSVSTPGFFESTYGMLLIVTIGSAALATLLWFLRTPAGAVVQNATKRFTKKIANSRVAVTISNGTKRFAKKLPAPVKVITKRFTAPAKTLTNRLATETSRMLKPTAKPK